LADNLIYLDRRAVGDANLGHRFQIFGKLLPYTHRSRDTAHAQWLQTHC